MRDYTKKRQLKIVLSVFIVILFILLVLLSFELFRVLTKDNVVNETSTDTMDSDATLNFIEIPETIKVPKEKPGFLPKSFAYVLSDYDMSTASKLRRFDVVVLDPYNADEDFMIEVKSSGSLVLANLDIGKAQNGRNYWSKLDKNILIKPDQDVDGEFFVDINDESWHNAIINYEIPYIFALGDSGNETDSYHGYDGLVIDNIDIINDYPEMKTGVYKLIKAISQKYPGLLIVVNRGFDILPLVYPFADGILYENMCYYYNEGAGRYQSKDSLKEKKVLINTVRKKQIPVFVLDHISTNPPNEGSALQCHDMATTYNVQGFNFLWNANSIDYELYLWDFLEIK